MSLLVVKKGFFRRTTSGQALHAVMAFFIIASTLLFLAGDVSSQELKRKIKKVVMENPEGVFRDIEKAWRGRNAELISRYAGSGRVYIDVQMLNRKGGYFSRPQVFFLFKRMFKNTKLLRFTFQRISKPASEGTRAYGIALRVLKDLRTGKIIRDKVYVTLKWNGNNWVLSEIKSMR